ncbi:MAG: hypothetical protein IIA44_04985, partial [Acidobacteria bacterium]|nr:hypothetical protein [Acidobacteriota bacterium]
MLLDVSDDDTTTVADPVEVTIINAPPQILTADVTAEINEGGVVTLSGTFSDPATTDPFQMQVTWEAGVVEVFQFQAGDTDFADALGGAPSHQYLDDGVSGSASQQFVIALQVFDDATPGNSTTVTTTVNNVAPVIGTLNVAPGAIDEGDPAVTLSGTFGDLGVADTHTGVVDWGDGSTTALSADDLAAKTFSVDHQYLDNPQTGDDDDYQITVTITDDDTGSVQATQSVTVHNVAPQITAIEGLPDPVNEGQELTLTAAIDDVAADLPAAGYAWEAWRGPIRVFPGVMVASGNGESFTWTPNDDDRFNVLLVVTDKDGGASAEFRIGFDSVNLPPVAVIVDAPVSGNEGEAITLTGQALDSVQDGPFTFSWSVTKDGQVVVQVFDLPGNTFTFTPDDEGLYTVELLVKDKDGLPSENIDSVTIDVLDVSATIALSGAAEVNEGFVYELIIGAVNEPGDDPLLGITIFWGDNLFQTVIPIPAEGTSIPHTYGDDGERTISVNLLEVGGSQVPNAGSLNVTVNNVVPVLLPNPDGLVSGGSVIEGSDGLVLVTGVHDPSVRDTAAGFSYQYLVGPVGNETFVTPYMLNASSLVIPGEFLADEPGTLVRVRVKDKDGFDSQGEPNDEFTERFTVISVSNKAPTVDAGPDAIAPTGFEFVQAGGFDDPGNDAPWTVEIWYGDGGVFGVDPADETLTVSERAFELRHTYDTSGANTVTVRVDDGDGGVGVDTMTVNVQNNTFRVSNFVPTDSGFEAQLNRAAMLVGALGDQVLNLYDGIDDPDDLPDVTLVGDSVGPVAGSMVWDAATRTMTFVKTGGPLLPDTYRATLVSSADAWQDESGELLDGDSDFVAGGDFVTDFLVGGGLDRVVSVPDFARGAGQAVNLPIMIDNGSGVVSVDVDLFYDPALLNISGALLGADVPAGWNIIPFFPPGEPGRLNLVLFSTSISLSGANLELVTLIANVPETAPYGGSHVIRLENLELNEDNIGSKADSAIHKAVYLGDANGSASYTGFDAALIAGVAVGANSGFDAFAWTDPVIVGDASGNGALSSFDAALVAQKAVLLDVDQIPDLPDPAIVLVEVEPGIDPQFSIPVGIPAAPGAEVVVPVSLDLDDVTNLRAADFVLTYDADLLEFVSATQGELLPAEDSWSFTVNGNEAGVVRVSLFNYSGNATGSGVIATVTLRVSPDAS